jgi:hypothetical protein
MAGWLYDDLPNGFLHFVLLTVVLGGAAAIASGRAIASGWKPFTIVPFYMVILAAVVRFLHYALFGGDILSIPGYIVALAFALLASGYGYRSKRARQMATQYSWIYARSGPLGWAAKGS